MSVNVVNCERVASALAQGALPVFFTMEVFYETRDGFTEDLKAGLPTACRVVEGMDRNLCRSAACIAGCTMLVLAPEERLTKPDKVKSRAAELLGLNNVEARQLFNPLHKNLEDITRGEAVCALTRLAKTGRVWWP